MSACSLSEQQFKSFLSWLRFRAPEWETPAGIEPARGGRTAVWALRDSLG